MDPDNLSFGFIDEIKIPVATGMYYDSKRKALLCGSGECIRAVKHRKIIKRYDYPFFNDIHSFSPTLDGNLLVVSTGTDSIFEFSLDNFSKPEWEWFATENGFPKTPTGNKRIISRNTNYQTVATTTPEHTTHINGCLTYKPNKILATLFHQGKIIEIDKITKKWKTILGGLKAPHNIRRTSNGYVVSDTLNNRVLLLSRDFKVENIIKDKFNWVQDALELEGGNYLIADSNNSRFIKISPSGENLDLYDYSSKDRKVYGFLDLTVDSIRNIFAR